MNNRFTKLIWGIFLLLTAALLILLSSTGFIEIHFVSIIASVLALSFIVLCILSSYYAPIPIPLAGLYIIYMMPLGLPVIDIWVLLLAAVISTIGLSVLLSGKNKNIQNRTEIHTKGNAPVISANFGAVNRRLHAEKLETVKLNCNFGSIDVYFDLVKLDPNGGTADINCSFGAVKLHIPKNWRVSEQITCSLGGVDMEKQSDGLEENAPQLTLTGNVSFGGVEVKFI